MAFLLSESKFLEDGTPFLSISVLLLSASLGHYALRTAKEITVKWIQSDDTSLLKMYFMY